MSSIKYNKTDKTLIYYNSYTDEHGEHIYKKIYYNIEEKDEQTTSERAEYLFQKSILEYRKSIKMVT